VSEFRLAVLASGEGTNLQAILDRVHGRNGIHVVGVASNKPAARALERARGAGVESAVFESERYGSRGERDDAMADWLNERRVRLVVLAGYMELVSPGFVDRFRHRIINVHPALLPAFPGLRAIEQAFDYGVKVTGVTVHYVDEGVDSGPIILQAPVALADGRDRRDIEAEIHRVEHELLPQAIELIATGGATLDEHNPRIVLNDERTTR